MTNAEIARQLVLSVRTIETHVANAMQRLGLHTRTELAAWVARDPIAQYKDRLLRNALLTADDIAQIEARVNSTIEAAATFAGSSPYPELAELTSDVYA